MAELGLTQPQVMVHVRDVKGNLNSVAEKGSLLESACMTAIGGFPT
jgi:hypothetical protein